MYIYIYIYVCIISLMYILYYLESFGGYVDWFV